LRKLSGFFARFHPASDQKIDDRFADRRAHLIFRGAHEPSRAVSGPLAGNSFVFQ
jgi:hypothetical protein